MKSVLTLVIELLWLYNIYVIPISMGVGAHLLIKKRRKNRGGGGKRGTREESWRRTWEPNLLVLTASSLCLSKRGFRSFSTHPPHLCISLLTFKKNPNERVRSPSVEEKKPTGAASSRRWEEEDLSKPVQDPDVKTEDPSLFPGDPLPPSKRCRQPKGRPSLPATKKITPLCIAGFAATVVAGTPNLGSCTGLHTGRSGSFVVFVFGCNGPCRSEIRDPACDSFA